MKKLLLLTIVGLLFLSFASAGISLETQPKTLYNLNDKVELNTIITPAGVLNDLVSIYLSCENGKKEVYKEYLYLDTEMKKDILIPLIKELIGELKGNCEIEYKIGENEKVISDKFIISDKMNLTLNTNGELYKPGKNIIINGTVIKENGKNANGIIEATLFGTKEIFVNTVIENGTFSLKIPVPDNFEAGNHKISFKAYEKNKLGEITNHVETDSSISIKQIPTNLEIVLNKNEIIPGNPLIGKVISRDQTGEKISATVYVAIKNEYNEIIEKIQTKTEEEFKYPIKYSQAPASWTVAVYSEDLIAKSSFVILGKKEISIDIINKTIIIENKGNIPYNESIDITIGNKTEKIKPEIGVGKITKYSLTAPPGEYKVKAGNVEKTIMLTGNAVKIMEIPDKKNDFMKIIMWIFLILILGIITFTFFKKTKNKTFFGRKNNKQAKKPLELKSLPELAKLVNPKKKSEISLTITGAKQNAPVGCIYIKNYEEIKRGIGGVSETLQKISDLTESKKGIVYQNKGNLFFIIPPSKTKTFDNEKNIIEIATSAIEIIAEHNRKFKIKIDYGISLNYGTIVTKETPTKFQFMSMGTLMTTSRKLANKSDGKILIGEKFKEKIKDDIKVEKIEFDGMNAYKFIELKSKKDYSPFVKNFLKKTYNK